MNYLYKEIQDIQILNSLEPDCLKKIEGKQIKNSEILLNCISVSDKILKDFPLVYLPDLLEDYVTGISDRVILKKYGIVQRADFTNIFKNPQNFDFKGTRTTSGANSKSKNLSRANFNQKYLDYRNAFNYFKEEFQNNFARNFFQALIIMVLLEENKEFEKNEIEKNIPKTYEENFRKFGILQNNELNVRVKEFLKKNIHVMMEDILIDLSQFKEITSNLINGEKYSIKNLDINILNAIRKILEREVDGIRRDKLESEIIKEFKILKLIPTADLFNKNFNDLKDKNIIHVEILYKNKSPQGDKIFTSNNFNCKNSQEKSEFFGRKNEPFEFVYQLQRLEKGDFNDQDDQVTRIASLILTRSNITSAPRDDLEDFDFVVNLEDFVPTIEEQKAMEKSDFKILGKKLHVKVMINETIQMELIDKIKNELNENEQAILISFKEISNEVKESTKNHQIEISTKDAILDWAKTVPILPSRTGSIVKIKSGRHVGKIARINNIDYVTGTTTFTMIPNTGIDYHAPIGTLEEVLIYESDDDDIVERFHNYEIFLQLIASKTDTREFEKAIFNPFEATIKKNSYTDEEKEWNWVMASKEINTTIDLKTNQSKCNCEYWNKNKNKFCEHQISLLNEKSLTEDWIDTTWSENNMMYKFINSK